MVGAYLTLFTVPAGETWLVKRVVTWAHTAAAGVVAWVVEVPSTAVQASHRVSLAAGLVEDRETWWALDAGCKLKVLSTGAPMTCMAHGAKLLGVA